MQRVRKVLLYISVLAMVVSLIPAHVSEAKQAKLTINKSVCVVKKGAKVKLKVSGAGKNKVKWSSTKKKIAVVNKKGVVKAKKKGTAVIKAKAGSKSVSCKIIVGVPVKKVSIANKTIRLQEGQTAKIQATVTPAKASIKSLSYLSKNKKVATVSGKGVITAVSAGQTKVVVTSKDGNKKSAELTVVVSTSQQNAGQSTPTASPSQQGASGSTSSTPTPKPEEKVSVTGITLSKSELILNVDDTETLYAEVTPANATNKKVTWTSEDNSVATVTNEGVVKGVAKGTVTISAQTEDGGFSAKCDVTVASSAKVSGNQDITSALAKDDLEILIIETDKSEKFTIPSGDYSNVDLIVDTPNGEIENYGKFKSVRILNIAEDTYYENATGNYLSVESAQAHIHIRENASATVQVAEKNKKIDIENDGTVEQLDIGSEGDVKIYGKSTETIPVSITKKANLVTSQNLQIAAVNTTFGLRIRSGAENTTVSVSKEADKPEISGLGMIFVTYADTGEVETVISNNNEEDEDAKDVKFAGVVKNYDDQVIEGAELYLVPYQAGYDVAGIASDSKAVSIKTDADGKYLSSAVKTGNYILYVKAEGYAPATQTVVITSVYGETYTNEAIKMIPEEMLGKKGGISGTITDSLTGKGVEGLTVSVRAGQNALTGKELTSSKTDENGYYEFEDLPAGNCTVQIMDKNTERQGGTYLPTSFTVQVVPDAVTSGQGTGVSQAISGSQVRFILTWGTEESGAISDADSHLVGPYTSDTEFHTYYAGKKALYGGETYADLDLDDTLYEGPETTTIYKEVAGTYSFYVHDYSNKGSNDSKALANSDVKVEVYVGSSKQATYHVPDEYGTLWHVCDYDSTTKTFTTVNEVSYYFGETADIGLSIKGKKGRILEYLDSIEQWSEFLDDSTPIQEKLQEYRTKLEKAQEDDEVSSLYSEVTEYYSSLCDMFRFSVSGDGVDDYDSGSYSNNITIYASRKLSADDVTIAFSDATEVKEVTPEEGAIKAYKVTENGLTRVFQFYVQLSLYNVGIADVSVNGESVGFSTDYSWDANWLEINDDYELDSLQVTFDLEGAQVTYGQDETTGRDKVTLTLDGQTKEWLIRKSKTFTLTDSGNTIYKTKKVGRYIYFFGENTHLGDGYSIKADGVELTIDYSYQSTYYDVVDAYDEDGYYYCIYYYPITNVCTLRSVYYYTDDDGYQYADVDDETGTITFYGDETKAPAEILNLHAETVLDSDDFDVSYSTEKAENKDYFATVTVSCKEISDQTKVYKVYYKQYLDDDEDYDEDDE